jgi:hypothetical protein
VVALGLPNEIPFPPPPPDIFRAKMGILRSKGNLETFTPGSVTRLLYPQVNKIKEKLQSGSVVLIDTENGKLKVLLSCVTKIKEVMWEVSFAFCNRASHLFAGSHPPTPSVSYSDILCCKGMEIDVGKGAEFLWL